MMTLALGLSACSTPSDGGVEAWWHQTVGGKINQARPAAPGDKAPFPNLATVPPQPAKADAAAWNRTTAGLMTDRVAAKEAAALAPIPGAPLPGAPPAPARLAALPIPEAGPSLRPPGSSNGGAGMSATFAGVSKTPGRTAASNGSGSSALPPLPVAQPPRANIAPAAPPLRAPATAAPPISAPRTSAGTDIAFVGRTDVLTETALEQVKAFAAARGEHPVAITGFGEAAVSDAVSQSAAVDLGMRRAQSLATALVAEGVPSRVLRLDAQAAGRGGDLRLLQ